MFSPRLSRFLPRLTVLLPALPDVYLSVQREVHVQPPVRRPLGDRGHIRLRDTPYTSHEASLEPIAKRREDLGKHNVHTHFPKDRNCEICKRTKITRAPCRRRKGEAVPRADNFGDLITADHKVQSDNCESRNNHRYAVVVQDLATQWIQAYPCKKQNFTRNPEKLAKVPGAREETKSHLH